MRKITLTVLIVVLTTSIWAQQTTNIEVKQIPWRADQLSVGIGGGLDFGGFGGNVIYYPVNSVGVFGGLGYALAGVGYNVGVKARFIPKKAEARVHPFAYAMYGYNAAVVVMNQKELNKLFYGPSLGVGIDFHRTLIKRGYWSFAVLVPIRKDEVNAYMDMLENVYGVDFQNRLFPITVSVGYKFTIQ